MLQRGGAMATAVDGLPLSSVGFCVNLNKKCERQIETATCAPGRLRQRAFSLGGKQEGAINESSLERHLTSPRQGFM